MPSPSKRTLVLTAGLVVLGALLGVLLWPAGPSRSPNVVLITVDTLRPDRLGCYGYERPTSPNVDRFAQQSVQLTNAFSTSNITPPAHASILTSQYLTQHGLLAWNPLPDSAVSLAEILQAQGYRTGANVNQVMLSRNALGQGFEWQREAAVRDGAVMVGEALDFIRQPADQPFFLWLHLFDVHRPYGRAPGWSRRFNGQGRPGVGDVEEHYNLLPEEVRARGLTQADLRFIGDRYDAGVLYFDSVISPLLEELTSRAHVEHTLVVITSDHGESLFERPEHLFTHDAFLYPPVTRVPILIRYPWARGAGQTYDSLVSLIDIAPTILDVLGVPIPDAFEGESLLPLLSGTELSRDEIYMECWGWEKQKAVRSSKAFVIHDVIDGETEYMDASSGGGLEPTDEEARRAWALLERFMSLPGAMDDPAPPAPEVREQLKSLGYVE